MKISHKKGDKFGAWELSHQIGQGGNSSVWLAVNKQSNQAAIKLCRYEKNNNKILQRFCDEVRAFKACQNIDGVLQLLDSYTPEKFTSDISSIPWLVTKLANPLEKVINDNCSLETIVSACASFANTLALMHDQGFSHRDIKPANLFFVDNKWCIGDFGLTWFPGKSAKTGAKEHIGPRFYIADEMLNNASVADGKSADVYSLAKVLWKLATGQRYPLQGTIRANEGSTRLSSYSEHTRSYLLDSIIERATQYDPSKRMSMRDFCDELNSWLNPPTLINEKKLSLDHLSHRLQSLHGDFDAEVNSVNESNNEIVQRINNYLGRFSNCLDSMSLELRQMGINVRRDNSQGNHHAWYVQKGDDGSDDVYFWQNFLTADLRKLPGSTRVSFFVGVCIRIEIERGIHGIKYLENGPVTSAAAIAINPTEEQGIVNLKKHVGDIREFILSGPKEDLVYQDLRSLLENNFEGGFELAIQYLENS